MIHTFAFISVGQKKTTVGGMFDSSCQSSRPLVPSPTLFCVCTERAEVFPVLKRAFEIAFAKSFPILWAVKMWWRGLLIESERLFPFHLSALLM